MPDYSKRTGYAPWSLTREAGVQSATVNGTIDIPQTCQPTINTGVIDERGNWQGVKASDEVFFGFTIAEGIADGGEVLAPANSNTDFIDMRGFKDLMIAVKPSGGGNSALQLVMGPDTNKYGGLSPVNSNAPLRYKGNPDAQQNQDFVDVLNDGNDNMTSGVWNIYQVQDRCRNWTNVQLRLTNNTGGIRDFEIAFMRLV